jgi:dolichol-phosphate mannosyltransferase
LGDDTEIDYKRQDRKAFQISTKSNNRYTPLSNFSILWYVHPTLGGIAVSMTSNFLSNRIWIFEDTDYSCLTRIVKQYVLFLGFSPIGGAPIQLILICLLVESRGYRYGASLVFAFLAGSGSNFVLKKKWTFKERMWGQC